MNQKFRIFRTIIQQLKDHLDAGYNFVTKQLISEVL